MPIYEYQCSDCGRIFEALLRSYAEAEASRPACPKCTSTKTEQQLSRFAVGSKDAAARQPLSGGCGTCGDPRGPGACSFDE